MRKYVVFWSEEDNEWVAHPEGKPGFSWLQDSALGALAGLMSMEGHARLDAPGWIATRLGLRSGQLTFYGAGVYVYVEPGSGMSTSTTDSKTPQTTL